jgi:NADH:ubiquinone oxidoreductase subunit 6 (subunit J)
MILASASNVLVWIVWVGAASACLASGVAVISFSNPFYSALALIGNLGSLAVLYLLLSAEFVAAAQVLVYAGAVMVMFLFVIAYLGGKADAPWTGHLTIQTWAAVVAAGALGRDRARDRRPGGRPPVGRRRDQRGLRQPGRDR